MKASLLGLAVVSLLVGEGWAQGSDKPLPVVDLGYELYQANSFNRERAFYNFSNVRYAAPPLGELRFKAPEYPAFDRSFVRTGSEGKICPQALPRWTGIAPTWLTNYITKGEIPPGIPNVDLSSQANASLLGDPRQTEDCLFLDVIVPQDVFEKPSRSRAPVLVWFHGGGYTSVSKSDSGDPYGLLNRSRTNGEEIIYVTINYRLGAFGFLSGPSFQQNGLANAGLHDQRFALEWIQRHISKFGGDPNRVTLLGESAGGGSVMHQITAYGGLLDVPFSGAIPQSPGWFPSRSVYEQEEIFKDLLNATNTRSVDELRALSTVELQQANRREVQGSEYGFFKYGPAVDGFFVPADPKTLLYHRQFPRKLNIMAGHNTNEGVLFTPPLTSDADFQAWARRAFRFAQPDVYSYIVDTLYPNRLDGSLGYRDQVGRAALVISEAVFTCNTVGLANAFDNTTYNTLFSVFPAIHGQDVALTYYVPGEKYTGGGGDSYISNFPVNETLAFALQDYIVTFAAKGKPDSAVDGLPLFRMYGSDASVIELGSELKESKDPASNERCRWWQLQLQN
ncbi:carboxylesterase family protein-like protein [Phyllosticta capitalensis]|uniref:Carboxylic ester hydrolase n=1 Tax=Phyllosticta capitalensis TaxID=121624 RepID=A0ABR1Y9B6_9PEZI